MKRWATMISALLAIGGTALLLVPYAQHAQAAAGWQTLFDGKNLDNWNQIGTANWKLVDGMAVADNGNGFLVSKNSYTDFDLRPSSGSRLKPTAASSFAAPIPTASPEKPPTR